MIIPTSLWEYILTSTVLILAREIQWGGGAYLFYLGVAALRQRHVPAADMAQGRVRRRSHDGSRHSRHYFGATKHWNLINNERK